MLEKRWVWYALVPALIAVGYWTLLQAVDVDGKSLRLTALPNPIFDSGFYMQLFVSDTFDGTGTLFHGLSSIVRPLLLVVRGFWPYLSLPEIYFLLTAISQIASIWLFARVFRVWGDISLETARRRSLIAFFIVQSTLGLRPGAASWYVPFLLGSLLILHAGYTNLEKGRFVRGMLLMLLAIILSAVYPWFLLFVGTTIVLLTALRFLSNKRIAVLVGICIAAAAALILFRENIAATLIGLSAFQSALRGGIGWSLLPTVSNTVLAFCIWWIVWVEKTRRDYLTGSLRRTTSTLILGCWTALGILWFQNVLTGAFFITDHLIYAVWIMSAVSWACWTGLATKLTRYLGAFALLFWLYLTAKIFFLYSVSGVGGLVVHWGIWSFLILSLTFGSSRFRDTIGFVIGVVILTTGVIGTVRFAALDQPVREYLRFLTWLRPTDVLQREKIWCSDWNAEQNLATLTGLRIFPSTVSLVGSVSTEEIQSRYVDYAAFFNVHDTDQGWRIDRHFLFSLNLRCDLNRGVTTLLQRLVKNEKTASYIIGCDREFFDSMSVGVISRMNARWEAPIPTSSDLCDRFIVRKSYSDKWRIPSSYPEIYSDEFLTVYGKD